jgi:alpha-beta hydrolase superfamily lysophospholipase
MSSTAASLPTAPSLALFGFEPLRAALEYASLRLKRSAYERTGDGHSVIIFPGLGTDSRAIEPLREFCNELGYTGLGWGRGLNTGPKGDVDAWLADLATHVRSLAAGTRQRMTLIGWSLGGIYAREVAKLLDGEVRQVITIGTPFAGSVDSTNVGLVYRLLNGQKAALDPAMAARLATAPPVPTTSIFSRSDGVVSWRACVQAGGRHVQNIEVDGSHCGLGWNHEVWAVIAARLALPDGRWKLYRRSVCQ